MFDINKTIMRCLVKNLAMFGLGLYIYAGEDLPEGEQEAPKTVKESSKKYAGNNITDDEAEMLENLLNKANVNIDKLCIQYKVNSLYELTAEQYMDIRGKLGR